MAEATRQELTMFTDRRSDVGEHGMWWNHGPSQINSGDPHWWQPVIHRATRFVHEDAVVIRCNDCPKWVWNLRTNW